MIEISQLYVFPVKSLAGISLTTAPLDSFGIQYDRHWMLVNNQGQFLTQRQHPILARIKTQLSSSHLILEFEDQRHELTLQSNSMPSLDVRVWKDSFNAECQSKETNQWFSDILKTNVHLVKMPQSAPRQTPHQTPLSFADGYPFLICSEESLSFINKHLKQKAEIIRFRPNIVITGCQPFEEDDWPEIATESVSFLAKKKCARCIMPTINQKTAEKDNPEILRVLNRYRKDQNKVFFGQNLIYKNTKIEQNLKLQVGDQIFFK